MKKYLQFIKENQQTRLNLSNQKLSELPDLPSSLQELWCYNNELKELPTLPPSLKYLDCNGNPLPEWCHERFNLYNLYDEELHAKFGSYAFQVKYLKDKPQNFERLKVFGYAKGIKEEFKY